MNIEKTIRDLAEAHLADNHHVDGVRFVDELLVICCQTGIIRCTLVDHDKLHFEVAGQAVDIQLGRAKTKLRLLCARLSVLCNEAGYETMSVYGGEGVVGVALHRIPAVAGVTSAQVADGLPGDATHPQGDSILPTARCAVTFKNTAAEQEFTITPE